jgi:hypothetical protein
MPRRTDIFSAIVACASVAACGGADLQAKQPDAAVVALSISGRGGIYDEIYGTAPCPEAATGFHCVQDSFKLLQAVLACGPTSATIDRSMTHVEYVYFPADLHSKVPIVPEDKQIVACVRDRVNFRFSAGVAADPAQLPRQDHRQFESLYAKKN